MQIIYKAMEIGISSSYVFKKLRDSISDEETEQNLINWKSCLLLLLLLLLLTLYLKLKKIYIVMQKVYSLIYTN